MSVVEEARRWAVEAHDGQVDRAGYPYVWHPQRVARIVALEYGEDHPAVVVAWLHDVVEDTSVTLVQIEQAFGPMIAQAVDAMSKRPGEALDDYYSRVRANPWALIVKHADIADNSDEARLEYLRAEEAQRLRDKYAYARVRLSGE